MMMRTILAGILCSGCYASHELAEPDAGPRRRCYIGCSTDDDCGPLYRCTELGRCDYQGCRTEDDCPPELGCGDDPWGVSFGVCAVLCTETADCAAPGVLGSVECRDGLCRATGCPSTEWCNDTFGPVTGLTYRCERLGAAARIADCLPVCERDTDCVSTLDPRPSECFYGHCVVPSCTSDDECAARYDDSRLRCSDG